MSSATCALVSSRDLHWSLHASKDVKDINLSTIRMLLLADRANPCESFVKCQCALLSALGFTEESVDCCFQCIICQLFSLLCIVIFFLLNLINGPP